jgi:hypothetical protein
MHATTALRSATARRVVRSHRTFAHLETACREFCEQVNTHPHRETLRQPVGALAEERMRLHPLPTAAFTVAFGTTRRVNWDATVSVEGSALTPFDRHAHRRPHQPTPQIR